MNGFLDTAGSVNYNIFFIHRAIDIMIKWGMECAERSKAVLESGWYGGFMGISEKGGCLVGGPGRPGKAQGHQQKRMGSETMSFGSWFPSQLNDYCRRQTAFQARNMTLIRLLNLLPMVTTLHFHSEPFGSINTISLGTSMTLNILDQPWAISELSTKENGN